MRQFSDGTKSNQSYRAAAYLRLSREDADGAQSNSITGQKELIRDFLRSTPEIQLCREDADDGYSGANFDRPAFARMMEAVKKGEINCILVKDLSRFGRNYIEAGRYIEQIFPFLGVRFIAINDHYDSLREENSSGGILVPFKNLINDAYCRDISVKVRSQLEIKRKNGDFIGSFAPYGYQKAAENKNQLVVDPYAAEVVRDIFRWRQEGLSQQGIARRLNERGIDPPAAYKKTLGLAYRTPLQTSDRAQWVANMVGRILNNAVYTGTLEQGKSTSTNFRTKQRQEKPREEWIRAEKTHQAIVSQEDFARMQQLLRMDTRVPPGGGEVYLLSGLVVCGDCLQSMVRHTVPAAKKQYVYYVCSQSKQDKSCTRHNISALQLEAAVVATLQTQVARLVCAKKLVRQVQALPCNPGEAFRLRHELDKRQAALAESGGFLLSLYEDYKSGILEQPDYRELKAAYSEKCARLKGLIEEGEQSLRALAETEKPIQAELEQLRAHGRLAALSRRLAVKLIDRILVFEGGRIEIKLRYRDTADWDENPARDAV